MTVDSADKLLRSGAFGIINKCLLTQGESKYPPVSNDPFGRALAGLIRGKHRETHLPDLDSASQAQRALSAVLIGRSRASSVIEYHNLLKEKKRSDTLNPSNARLHPMRPALCVLSV